MRTTLELPDSLVREARRLAAARGVPFRAVVEEALRLLLKEDRKEGGEFRLKDRSFQGDGWVEGLEHSDWSRIRALAYEGRGER